jgi:hypothetical protein
MNGQCLCGAVKFRLKQKPSNIYQCHCSQCRKITGTSSNSSCIVHKSEFEWLEGKSNISSYSHDSGYRSDFCRTCGSSLPNEIRGTSFYWVPVGALDDSMNIKVVAHLCVNSKASWERIIGEGIKYSGVPDFNELLTVVGLKPNNEI